MDEWRAILRETRVRLGITQAQLAQQLGISPETVRGYESRATKPPRERLEALIAGLKIPNAVANEMRSSAGYAARPTIFDGVHDQHRYYDRAELAVVVETIPWPEFVVDDAVEVVAANASTQAVWGIDFAHERSVRTRAQMNLLAVASDNHFADRVKNWDECIGILIAMFKANDPPWTLESPTPYFEEVIKEFVSGDPVFLSRLFDVWNRTEAMDGRIRWTYPVVWEDPEHGEMRFLATVSLANEEHATFFNDWIPVDAETWVVLERVKARAAR